MFLILVRKTSATPALLYDNLISEHLKKKDKNAICLENGNKQ